jgi:hypothetical protein
MKHKNENRSFARCIIVMRGAFFASALSHYERG